MTRKQFFATLAAAVLGRKVTTTLSAAGPDASTVVSVPPLKEGRTVVSGFVVTVQREAGRLYISYAPERPYPTRYAVQVSSD